MNVRQLKFGIIVAAAIAASGCGIFGHKKPSTPVLGERIAVLAAESDVAVDPATAAALPVEQIWALCDELVDAHRNYLAPSLRAALR